MGYETTLWFSSHWLTRGLSFPAILKYCPKRQHFSYVGMQAYIELAILDHNYNTQRKQTTTKDGIYAYMCVVSFHVYFQVKLDIR